MNLNKLKTADELGKDKPEEAKPAETESEPKLEGEAPEDDAAETAAVQYITPGIANFRVGEYQFKNGTMSLTPEAAAAFDALLEELPPSESCRIQKVNVDAAEKIAAQFKAAGSTMTAGVDTSDSGEAARKVAAE